MAQKTSIKASNCLRVPASKANYTLLKTYKNPSLKTRTSGMTRTLLIITRAINQYLKILHPNKR